MPQQHRLITLSPGSAPLLLGLNSAALYVGVSASGVIGAVAIELFDRNQLGAVGAALVAVSLVIAEQAYRLIRREGKAMRGWEVRRQTDSQADGGRGRH